MNALLKSALLLLVSPLLLAAEDAPIELVHRDGATTFHNRLPFDLVILLRESESDFRLAEAPSASSITLRGRYTLEQIKPVSPDFRETSQTDCAAMMLGGNVRDEVTAALALLRMSVESATADALDSANDAMRLRHEGAIDEFMVMQQDPRWLHAADEAIERGNYPLAGTFQNQHSQQQMQTALYSVANLAEATMEMESMQRQARSMEANLLAQELKRSDERMERIRHAYRQARQKAKVLTAYTQRLSERYQGFTVAANVRSLRRACHQDAQDIDTLLLDARADAPAMIRVKFDRGGSIDAVAFPARDAQDVLVLNIPVPTDATKATVYAGKKSVGEVRLRARSRERLLSDANAAHRRIRKDARSAKYASQGGANLDGGATIW